MKEHAHTLAVEHLADAVQAVLDTPSVGLSPEIREALADAVGRTRNMLPPHLFYATVEQAPIAISITDPDAGILYVNPAFERVTGYGRGEVVGQNESLLSDKSTPSRVYRDLWSTVTDKRTWFGKLVNRRKCGERYLAELMIAPVLDDDGTIRHYLGIHRDITELYRLEQQVINQKQLIETTVDAAPMAVALLDEGGTVVLDNMAYRSLATDMHLEPAHAFLAALPTASWARDITGTVFNDEEVSLSTGSDLSERWFACSGTWIRDMDDSASGFFARKGKRYLLLVAQEITRLKRQQEETRHSALRALVAEEALVQGLREAIGAAEFQLQGPFNMLKAAVGMLERRGVDDADSALIGVLRQALSTGREALELLRGAMPRESRDPLARVNLNQLLRDLLSLATERMLTLGVQVDWRPAAELPTVMGYENRLRAMFKHLLDNALDAMEGKVPRRELRVMTEAVGDAVRVIIEDSGTGIPEALRFKVFEPFFTTREAGKHAGMGLAMVQEVLNQHQGTLAHERVEEGGCRMHLQLPARKSAISREQML